MSLPQHLAPSSVPPEVDEIAQQLMTQQQELEERSGVGSASSEERSSDSLRKAKEVQEKLERLSNISKASQKQESLERCSNVSANSQKTRSSDGSGSLNSLHVRGRGGYMGEHGRLKSHSDLASSSRQSSSVQQTSAGGHQASSSHEVPGSVSSTHRDKNRTPVTSAPGSAAVGSSSGKGSGNGSNLSGSDTKADNSSNVFNSMSHGQQDYMKGVIANLELNHSIKLEDIERCQTASDAISTSRIRELLAQVAKMDTSEKVQAHLQELLNASRRQRAVGLDEQDDMKEEIRQLLIKKDAAAAKNLKDVADQEAASIDKAEVLSLLNFTKLEDLQKELFAAEAGSARNAANEQAQADLVTFEVSDAKDKAAEVKKEHADALEKLQNLLDIASRELGRRDKLSEKKVGDADDFADAHALEELLRQAKGRQHETQRELAASRLELHNAKQSHEADIAGVQNRLQLHENSQAAIKGGSSRRPMKAPTKSMGLLQAIQEELDPDDLGSTASSNITGQVSSDGAGVGDLQDFDEADEGQTKAVLRANEILNLATIRKLTEELTASGFSNTQLQFDKDALKEEQIARVAALVSKLNASREAQFSFSDLLDKAEIANRSEQVANELAMDVELQKREDLELAHKGDVKENKRIAVNKEALVFEEMEEWQERLHFAMEAKRLESARLEDTKRELEAIEVRHALVVSDLSDRLGALGAPVTSLPALPPVGLTMDSVRARENEQELNVLKNEHEILKVESQSKLEQEQLQNSIITRSLAKKEEELNRERQTNLYLQEELQQAKEQLKLAKATASAQQPQPANPQPTPVEAPPSVWSFLRCPARSSGLKDTLLRATLESGLKQTSCHEALWEMACTLRGIIALQCSVDELTITDSSRKAYEIFGSANLNGACVTGLLSDARTSKRLQQELASRTSPAKLNASRPFWLGELGCMEFKGKRHDCFDSLVIAAYLPAEPDHGNDACVFIVVEPMEEVEQDRSAAPSKRPTHVGGQMKRIGSYQHSYANSVGSNDIGPNDSISNVL